MISLSEEQREFIRGIGDFEKGVRSGRTEHGHHGASRKSVLEKAAAVGSALGDYLSLLLVLLLKKSCTEIFFVSYGLIEYFKFIKANSQENALLISYHPTRIIPEVNGSKVYNLGVVIGLISRILRKRNTEDLVNISNMVYLPIYRFLRGKMVYIPCFHDFNGYALMFNPHRKMYRLVEVQHGGICNYFPFRQPVFFPLVDQIYVDNLRTKRYLLEHLYRNVDVDIVLKEGTRGAGAGADNKKPVLLYCSTIETNGIHPVVLEFLRLGKYAGSYDLVIRLHPREKGMEQVFVKQLNELSVRYRFDNGSEWLTANNYANMIVISPWSSVIEQAYDNGIMAIVVDRLGLERYSELIDNKICHYSDSLIDLLPPFLDKARALPE